MRKIALHVAKGLAHCHERGVIHHDVKSANVLVDGSYNAKVANFGLAGPPRPPTPDGVSGTYQYMAPEVLSGEPHSRKSDVYAFGVLLCEMIAGAPPFQALDAMQAAQHVLNDNARPDIPRHCTRAYADVIQSCWAAAPAARPHFDDVVRVLETNTK